MNTMQRTLPCRPEYKYSPRSTPLMEMGVKIKEFDAISLSKLDETGARLLNKVESKYLMTVGQCMDF